MNRRLSLLLVLALGGCAPAAAGAARGTTPAAPSAAVDPAAEDARAAELMQQRERVRELEAQLGLAQATSRELRDEVRALRERDRRRATRIGGACEAGASPAEPAGAEPEVQEVQEVVALAEASEPEAQSDGPRPVLRLYGAAPVALDDGGARPALVTAGVRPIPGPIPPPVVGAPPAPGLRLPVLGGADDGVPSIPAAPLVVSGDPAPSQAEAMPVLAALQPAPPPRPTVDPDREAGSAAYRAALQHLAERRPADALAGIEDFLSRFPRHPYADNALYWRGEIHYVRRDYRRALSSFSDLIERYPEGNKVPDALLRIGHCYQRMGQTARATRVFDRLRAQYPDSVAARMTSQEDA